MHRPFGIIKREIQKMWSKQRVRFYLVIGFSILFVILVLTGILCVDDNEQYAKELDTTDHVLDNDANTVWETALPLGIPLYRWNLRLYSSTL